MSAATVRLRANFRRCCRSLKQYSYSLLRSVGAHFCNTGRLDRLGAVLRMNRFMWGLFSTCRQEYNTPDISHVQSYMADACRLHAELHYCSTEPCYHLPTKPFHLSPEHAAGAGSASLLDGGQELGLLAVGPIDCHMADLSQAICGVSGALAADTSGHCCSCCSCCLCIDLRGTFHQPVLLHLPG